MQYFTSFDFWALYNDLSVFFFFQAEDGIRDLTVTGVQTCALPIFGYDRATSGKSMADDLRLRELMREYQSGRFEAFDELYRSEERRVGKECRSRWLADH